MIGRIIDCIIIYYNQIFNRFRLRELSNSMVGTLAKIGLFTIFALSFGLLGLSLSLISSTVRGSNLSDVVCFSRPSVISSKHWTSWLNNADRVGGSCAACHLALWQWSTAQCHRSAPWTQSQPRQSVCRLPPCPLLSHVRYQPPSSQQSWPAHHKYWLQSEHTDQSVGLSLRIVI